MSNLSNSIVAVASGSSSSHFKSLMARPFLPVLDNFLQERLTEEEQRMYQTLMVLRYATDEPFPVAFDPLWNTLQYTRRDNAIATLKQHFNKDTDYRVFSLEQQDNSGRGRPTSYYALTLDAAQHFAMESKTEQGRKVREFFVKTLHALQDYHVLSVLDSQRKAFRDEQHRTLVEAFHNKKVVYVAIIEEREDGFVTKVGHSLNIYARAAEHRSDYGQQTCLVFAHEVVNNRELEQHLFHLPIFIKQLYTAPVHGKISPEHFHAGHDGDFTLAKMFDIIRREGRDFQYLQPEAYLKQQELSNEKERLQQERIKLDLEKARLEMDKQKLELENSRPQQTLSRKEAGVLQRLSTQLQAMETKLDAQAEATAIIKKDLDTLVTEQKPDAALNTSTTKGITGPSCNAPPPPRVVKTRKSRGPYVQKLEPDTLDILRVYDGIMAAVREEDDISSSGLKLAAKRASVYHGFRWFLVQRKKNPHEKQDVPATNTSVREVVHGPVAELNYMKTEVTAVYPDQKRAAQAKGLAQAGLSRAVNQGDTAGRCYWQLWNKCAPGLRAAYIERHGEPIFSAAPKVDEYDTTGRFLRNYSSQQEVVKLMGMSPTKLAEILKSGEVFRDRVFKVSAKSAENLEDSDDDPESDVD